MSLKADRVQFFDSHPGSLTAGENALLHVPMGSKRKLSAKESPKENPRTPLINKSLYPLHLRRGAVSPASFSLKSASTASSLNALPRGYNELYNALSGKGPIILLSDQASVQSLCSLNSRMTCSCSSLRSAGSDGTAGDVEGIEGNRTRVGSDGSFVYSPTEKAEGTYATLSVPVECHGKRKDSSESRNGVKETESNHGMSETKKKKSDSDQTYNNNETNEDYFEPVEFVSQPNEWRTGNSNEDSFSSRVDYQTNGSPVPIINDGAVTSNTTIETQNANENNTCQHCQEAKIELPVKPVPVIGRTVSAYSIMEYNIGKNTLPSKDKSGPVCDDNSDNGPKRRHSAFTPCYENSSLTKRRKGLLSTSCMKKQVAECEPLINGTAVRAHPSEETDGENEEEDIFSSQGENTIQGWRRTRKSGVSDCSSPTKFIEETNPLRDGSGETDGNHGDQNLSEETCFQPCSSSMESLNNGSTARGNLPTIKIQYENNPEPVRTSRV